MGYSQWTGFRVAAPALLGVWAGLIAAGCNGVRLPDPDVRYIAFGDSSTAGPTPVDYPDVLADLLEEPANYFANEGSGGESTGEGIQRLEKLFSQEIYPNAHTLLYWQGGADVIDLLRQVDPFLVFSLDAANYPFATTLDQTLDTAQANMEAIIAMARDRGLSVYIATYPLRPATPLACDALPIPIMVPGQVEIANAYNRRINERIRQAAANTGAVLVDVAADPRLIGNPTSFVDCNHLSESGNRVAAEVFAAAITGGSD